MVPILVDCTQAGAHRTYLDTYQVRGFPTLLFVGSGGEELSKVERRDAATLLRMIEHFSQGRGGSPWVAPAVMVLIAIAVTCGLVFVYKKWFAAEAE